MLECYTTACPSSYYYGIDTQYHATMNRCETNCYDFSSLKAGENG